MEKEVLYSKNKGKSFTETGVKRFTDSDALNRTARYKACVDEMLNAWNVSKGHSWPIRAEFRALAGTFSSRDINQLGQKLIGLSKQLIRVIDSRELASYRENLLRVYDKCFLVYDVSDSSEYGASVRKLYTAFIKSLSARTDERKEVRKALRTFWVENSSREAGFNCISIASRLQLKKKDEGISSSPQKIPQNERDFVRSQNEKRIKWFKASQTTESPSRWAYNRLAQKRPDVNASPEVWAKWLIRVLINDFWSGVPAPKGLKKGRKPHLAFDIKERIPKIWDATTVETLFNRPQFKACLDSDVPSFVEYGMRYFRHERRQGPWAKMLAHVAYTDVLELDIPNDDLDAALEAELDRFNVLPESDIGVKLYRTGKSDGGEDKFTWVKFRTRQGGPSPVNDMLPWWSDSDSDA